MGTTNFPNGVTLDTNTTIGAISGSTIPASGTAGYSPGAIFTLSNAALGQCPSWVNVGTAASCLFIPSGPLMGYGFQLAGQATFSTGVAALAVSLAAKVKATDLAFADHHTSDDNDQLISVKATEGVITITNGADPLTTHGANYSLLRNKTVPEYDIFAAGKHTTVGGFAAEAITVAGVLASDIAFACYSTSNDLDLISDVVCTANTVTVTCSADPLTAHVLDYVVLRPRGSFKPSHYVAYAGERAAITGDTTAVPITVTGALATDVAMVNYSVTDDTDTLVKAVASAGLLTLTVSADPVTGHSWNYALLRAY